MARLEVRLRPLNATKVVSLALNVPGPVAVTRLVTLGASAIKIEPPAGDPLKRLCQPWYTSMIRRQRVAVLDLHIDQDRSRLLELLADADLLLTSFRPSALKRLGLDWKTMHKQFARLCVLNIVGYPPPKEEIPGHDLTYQAKLGLLRPPQLPITLHCDLACAERVVTVTLSLLLNRAQTGRAEFAYVSLFESMQDFSAPLDGGLTATGGALGGGLSFYDLYQTSGGWIALAALETRFSNRLRAALKLKTDDRAGLERIFRRRTASEWERWARKHDLPLVAVREFPLI